MSSPVADSHESSSSSKAKYRITNWPAYDRALVARGDITFWFDPEAIAQHLITYHFLANCDAEVMLR